MSIRNLTINDVSEALDAELSGNGSGIASDVTHDSRQAHEGTLFVAITGATMDGHRFIEDVMRRGAVGIVSESDRPADFTGAWLKVADARGAQGRPDARVLARGVKVRPGVIAGRRGASG